LLDNGKHILHPLVADQGNHRTHSDSLLVQTHYFKAYDSG